jgi:hypothetical protein
MTRAEKEAKCREWLAMLEAKGRAGEIAPLIYEAMLEGLTTRLAKIRQANATPARRSTSDA